MNGDPTVPLSLQISITAKGVALHHVFFTILIDIVLQTYSSHKQSLPCTLQHSLIKSSVGACRLDFDQRTPLTYYFPC